MTIIMRKIWNSLSLSLSKCCLEHKIDYTNQGNCFSRKHERETKESEIRDRLRSEEYTAATKW
jgi:hypothetical protein